MTPRPHGDGGLHWDERRQRWMATTTVGYDGTGKRVVRKASGRTKTEAKSKLREMLRSRDDGLAPVHDRYTVSQAVDDWLTHGLSNRNTATQRANRYLCEKHLLPQLGRRKIRDLSAAEVDAWLSALAQVLSTRTVQAVRSCLNRAVKRAMARDLVRRNVVELTEVPTGRAGRPSKALTAQEADDVLELTKADRLHPYIVMSLLTGARTEELRALEWRHVHLQGRADVSPPVPPLRRGLALRPLRRRHEDPPIPTHPRPSQPLYRSVAPPAGAASRRACSRRQFLAGTRSRLPHTRRNGHGCGQRSARASPCFETRPQLGPERLDPTRASTLLRLVALGRRCAHRRDLTPGGSQRH